MAIAEQEVTDNIPAPDPNGDAPQSGGNRLILDSLEIKNFRAFRHLTIPKLGRVNLITGKNGVGKSSLLEALYLYAHSASPQAVRQVLLDRREVVSGGTEAERAAVRVNLGSVFHAVDPKLLSREWAVGAVEAPSQTLIRSSLHFTLTVKDSWPYSDDTVNVFPVFGEDYEYSAFMIEQGVNSAGRLLPPPVPEVPCTLLKSSLPSGNELAAQWDDVALTPSEDIVLRVLRVIKPQVQRVAFIAETSSPLGRVAMVGSSEGDRPGSMARLGDGLTRAFSCALALTDATNGIALIDEIENGLHYSVLPDVWRLIFATARRLNVQVFATTHSWDCIEAFQQAAAEDDVPNSGVLVRLQNEDGDVTATVFDERRLAIATREGIEVR